MATWQTPNMRRRALRFLKPGDNRLASFKMSVLGLGLGGMLYNLQAGHQKLVSPPSPAFSAFIYEKWSLTSESTNDVIIWYHRAREHDR